MIKTIHKSEYKKLKSMIGDYHQYILTHPKSLINRHYGLY